MIRAAIIGRFQPFHLGHLELVRQVLMECEELIILIGSSQINYTIKNPFTAGERLWMIRESLLKSKFDLNHIMLIHIMDEINNSRWFSSIKSFTPPFDLFYTGNLFVRQLIQRESIRVKEPTLVNKNLLKGSVIRRLILEDDPHWYNLVPDSVRNIIKKIDGEVRIRIIHSSWEDSPSSEEKIN